MGESEGMRVGGRGVTVGSGGGGLKVWRGENGEVLMEG